MRRNYPKHSKHRAIDRFDIDYVYRPDMPDIARFIDYQRKVIMINMDAAPDAALVMHINRPGADKNRGV